MSKTARLRNKVARLESALARQSEAMPAAFDAGGGVGNTSARGYIDFPRTRSRDQLRPTDRREMVRVSQWAASKVGSARWAIHGLARRAGVVSLAADNEDEKFNKEHAEWWQAMYGDAAGNYDVTGRYTAESFVQNAMQLCFRDGDVLLVNVTGSKGEPLVAAVESTAVRSDYGYMSADWIDGVRVDPRGKPLQYRVVMSTDGLGMVEREFFYDAKDATLLGNFETHDHVRGFPALFAVLDRVRDGREVANAAIKSAKAQGLVALYLEREMGTREGPLGNLTGKTRTDNLAGSGTQTTKTYGAPSEIKRMVQEAMDDAEIWDNLPPGVVPKVLNDGRDFSAQEPLQQSFLHQIAWGVGVDPRALFNLDGLTGPAERRVLVEFQKWRESWQSRQLSFLRVDYLRRTEWAVRTKAIRMPADGQWWKYTVNWPAAATIDNGRDATAQSKRLENHLTTLQSEYGEAGEDWKKNAEQSLIERAYLKERGAALGLKPEEIFSWVKPERPAAAPAK